MDLTKGTGGQSGRGISGNNEESKRKGSGWRRYVMVNVLFLESGTSTERYIGNGERVYVPTLVTDVKSSMETEVINHCP